MREIGFRAYHKKEGRFYYFDLETCTKTAYPGYYHPITNEKDCELDDVSLYSEKQLYTGLKDKNGTKIFEGDFLRFTLAEMGYVETGVIAWHHGGFFMQAPNGQLHLPAEDRREVIGNIYEGIKEV